MTTPEKSPHERFINRVQMELEYANDVLADFTKKFQADPLYAIEYGRDAVRCAGIKSIGFHLIKPRPMSEDELDKMMVEWQAEVLHLAGAERTSTSTMSNEASSSKLQAKSMFASMWFRFRASES